MDGCGEGGERETQTGGEFRKRNGTKEREREE